MKNLKKLFLTLTLLTFSNINFIFAMNKQPGKNSYSSSSIDPSRKQIQPSHSLSKQTNIILGKRPKNIQKAIDKEFAKISSMKPEIWTFDGNVGFYELFKFEETKIFEMLASKKNKNNIYIIDVGGGQGAWSQKSMVSLLNNETCKNSGKHFYIFNITGGTECEEKSENKDNVTLYFLNRFKIENIDVELPKRMLSDFDIKIDLTGKVDFIVSRYTFLHLVDPFGSIKRIYQLLTPLQGILLSTGFNFELDDSNQIYTFPGLAQSTKGHSSWYFLAETNAISIFMVNCILVGSFGQFLLMRTNYDELEIPLAYTNELRKKEYEKFVAVYKKESITQKKPYFLKFEKKKTDEDIDDPEAKEYGYCCCEKNPKSKELFEYLKQNGLFSWQ